MNSWNDCGLIPICQNEKWGYTNKNGRIVIPCKWDLVGYFHEGRAWVRNSQNRYGYIDESGQEIISCIFLSASDFDDGTATVVIGDFSPVPKDLDILSLPNSSWIDIDREGMPLNKDDKLLDYLCQLENYCSDPVSFVRYEEYKQNRIL